MSADSKKRLVAGTLCVPLLAVMSSYLGSVAFAAIVWRGKPPFRVMPHTVYQYLSEYGFIKELRLPFLVGIGIPTLLTLAAVGALLFYRKRPTLHGDGRWATMTELKKAKMVNGDGIVLGELNGKIITAHPEHHIEGQAPTGGGKGISIVIPNLLTWNGSVVVNDIKGENFDMTSRFREACGHKVFVFNPSDAKRRTHRWNPFFYVNPDPDLRGKGLQRIAAMLWPPEEDKGEPFKPGARGLFTTIALWHLENGLEPTLAKVATFGATMDEKAIKEKITAQHGSEGEFSASIVTGFAEFFNLPDKFRESVRGEFNLGLEVITKDPLLQAATGGNDFDAREFRNEPVSLYVVTPGPDLGRLRKILSLLFQQIAAENTEVEFKLDPLHRNQLAFMMDEFSSLGDVAAVVDPIAYYRSYGIKLITIYQSQSQVEGIYGESRAATFSENHKTKVVFQPATMSEAKRISEELPKTTSYSISTSGRKMERKSISHSEAARPLMLPDEVKLLPEEDLIIFAQGMPPVRIKKLRYFENKLMVHRLKSISPTLAALGRKLPSQDDYKAARRNGELAIVVPALRVPEREFGTSPLPWKPEPEATPVFRSPTADDVGKLAEMSIGDFKVGGELLAPPPPESTPEERKAYADEMLSKIFD